jgi:hypothetical protein
MVVARWPWVAVRAAPTANVVGENVKCETVGRDRLFAAAPTDAPAVAADAATASSATMASGVRKRLRR